MNYNEYELNAIEQFINYELFDLKEFSNSIVI